MKKLLLITLILIVSLTFVLSGCTKVNYDVLLGHYMPNFEQNNMLVTIFNYKLEIEPDIWWEREVRSNIINGEWHDVRFVRFVDGIGFPISINLDDINQDLIADINKTIEELMQSVALGVTFTKTEVIFKGSGSQISHNYTIAEHSVTNDSILPIIYRFTLNLGNNNYLRVAVQNAEENKGVYIYFERTVTIDGEEFEYEIIMILFEVE